MNWIGWLGWLVRPHRNELLVYNKEVCGEEGYVMRHFIFVGDDWLDALRRRYPYRCAPAGFGYDVCWCDQRVYVQCTERSSALGYNNHTDDGEPRPGYIHQVIRQEKAPRGLVVLLRRYSSATSAVERSDLLRDLLGPDPDLEIISEQEE